MLSEILAQKGKEIMLRAVLSTLVVMACVIGFVIFIFYKAKEYQYKEKKTFDDLAEKSNAKVDQELQETEATFCGYCGRFNFGKVDVCRYCGAILNKEKN